MPESIRFLSEKIASPLRWLWLSGLLIVLDQWSKAAVTARFEMYETLRVLPVFNLTLAHNTGVAFSVFAHGSGWQRWVFSALALVVSVVLVGWLRALPRHAHLTASALSLIIAGALGNMFDRLRFGYVVDFLQWHWAEHYFPAFNVADAAITVGAGLLILESVLSSRGHRAGG
jgi:signal peptidase II